jgi:tRNA (cmo5U34)-methyltransferase
MKSWTFETPEIAEGFDAHVREQLPWYDMVTDAVCYIIRNYLPQNGTIVDIGASTGNLIDKIYPLILERNIDVVAIEKSLEMCEILNSKYESDDLVTILYDDCSHTDMPRGDVYVLFLTLMFIPLKYREIVLKKIKDRCSTGGVIIVVDKICDHQGYFSTVLKRLTMHFKLQQGAKLEDVLTKEMSLAGVQIPLDPAMLGEDAKLFFRMGEFAGWVIER